MPNNANLIGPDANFDGPQQATFNQAILDIQALGATIVITSFTDIDLVINDLTDPASVQNLLTVADFVAELPEYVSLLDTNPNGVTDIFTLREFIQTFVPEKYPTFGTSGFDIIVGSIAQGQLPTPGTPEYEFLNSIRIQGGTEGGLPGAVQRDNLDAIILPSEIASISPSLVGLPGISVPMGRFPDGNAVSNIVIDADPDYTVRDYGPNLPIGLSFFGEAWSGGKAHWLCLCL